MTKRKRYKPIELHVDAPDQIFDIYKGQISKSIIEAISFALRNKKKRVDFAYIIVKNFLVITLSIDNNEFIELIEENLQNLIEVEDYETCALAMKLKNKILKTNDTQVPKKVGVDD